VKEERVEISLFLEEIIALCFFKTRLLHKLHFFPHQTRWLLRRRRMECVKKIWLVV
jgi:hypothetical protein